MTACDRSPLRALGHSPLLFIAAQYSMDFGVKSCPTGWTSNNQCCPPPPTLNEERVHGSHVGEE